MYSDKKELKMTQQFFKGDLVSIAGDLGPTMTHFPKGVDAIVLYSYAEHYDGGRGKNQYCLFTLGDRHLGEYGESSWYYEDQLTFKEQDRFDLLPKSHIDRRNFEAKQARAVDLETV
jgi:hypothetical protein